MNLEDSTSREGTTLILTSKGKAKLLIGRGGFQAEQQILNSGNSKDHQMNIFNLYIENDSRCYNILHIDQGELDLIIDAYNYGKADLFINGERFLLKNLLKIKIFKFKDLKTSKKFIEFSYDKMKYTVDFYGKMYLEPRVLEVGGEDVTRNYIEGDYGHLNKDRMMVIPTTTPNSEQHFTMDIFISHSSKDAEVTKALVNVIRKALHIRSKSIRCTSLNEYRLSAGVDTDESLREEIFKSKAFIAVITSNSVDSNYVTFELGARWGSKLPMLPIICDPAGTSLLNPPLTGINALSATNAAQIQRLIEDLAKILSLELEPSSTYTEEIEALKKLITKPKQPVRVTGRTLKR